MPGWVPSCGPEPAAPAPQAYHSHRSPPGQAGPSSGTLHNGTRCWLCLHQPWPRHEPTLEAHPLPPYKPCVCCLVPPLFFFIRMQKLLPGNPEMKTCHSPDRCLGTWQADAGAALHLPPWARVLGGSCWP